MAMRKDPKFDVLNQIMTVADICRMGYRDSKFPSFL